MHAAAEDAATGELLTGEHERLAAVPWHQPDLDLREAAAAVGGGDAHGRAAPDGVGEAGDLDGRRQRLGEHRGEDAGGDQPQAEQRGTHQAGTSMAGASAMRATRSRRLRVMR